MVILQTMGWFLENPNHGYYYNQHSHRLVHTCRKSPPLNLFVFVIAVKWKAIKLVPATYFPPLSKHHPDVLKSTLTNKNQIIKLTITQMHTHFTQLYIAGDFPYLTDVVRISGREWGPTRPSHHLNLFPFMLFCHFGQSEQSLTKCNLFPISKCPASPHTLLKVNPVLCNWLL